MALRHPFEPYNLCSLIKLFSDPKLSFDCGHADYNCTRVHVSGFRRSICPLLLPKVYSMEPALPYMKDKHINEIREMGEIAEADRKQGRHWSRRVEMQQEDSLKWMAEERRAIFAKTSISKLSASDIYVYLDDGKDVEMSGMD